MQDLLSTECLFSSVKVFPKSKINIQTISENDNPTNSLQFHSEWCECEHFWCVCIDTLLRFNGGKIVLLSGGAAAGLATHHPAWPGHHSPALHNKNTGQWPLRLTVLTWGQPRNKDYDIPWRWSLVWLQALSCSYVDDNMKALPPLSCHIDILSNRDTDLSWWHSVFR